MKVELALLEIKDIEDLTWMDVHWQKTAGTLSLSLSLFSLQYLNLFSLFFSLSLSPSVNFSPLLLSFHYFPIKAVFLCTDK